VKTLLLSALLALLCACATVPEAPAPSPEPEQAQASIAEGERVLAFLAQYRAQFFRGLPNATQAAALAPHLSPRLNGLLHDALAGQQAYKAKYPTDKPPMIDGDIFSSLFEGASSGEIDTVDATDARATVRVKYSYSDPETHKVIETWPDNFLLVRDGSGWLIDDIEYLGGWDFAPRGRLSVALTETAALGK
jgi:hypothetical protein